MKNNINLIVHLHQCSRGTRYIVDEQLYFERSLFF